MIRLLVQLLVTFARVGLFGFGGGPSMIPLMQTEVVDSRGWMTESDFLDALAVGNALPGPITTKMAALVGYRLASGYSFAGGVLGALVGLTGLILPTAVAMVALLALTTRYQNVPAVQKALLGARPAVVALLAWTAVDLAPSGINGSRGLLIGLAAFMALTFAKVHPALVIVAAALTGVFIMG